MLNFFFLSKVTYQQFHGWLLKQLHALDLTDEGVIPCPKAIQQLSSGASGIAKEACVRSFFFRIVLFGC